MRSLPLADPGTPPLRGPAAYLWWTARRQWGILLAAVACGVVQFACQAFLPFLTGRAIDGGLEHGFGPDLLRAAGALLTLLVVVIAYRLFRFRPIAGIFGSAMRESVMIMMIMAAAELFSFALSSLFVTQTVASAIASLEVNRWVLMAVINLFLLVAGMFLPPVAVIVMSAPLLFPIVTQAGFDPYWFAIVLTINMEVGLITPPVGLNLFVINAIAPQVPTREILWGSLPYVLVMFLAILILCIFPEIATWLPDQMMGSAT